MKFKVVLLSIFICSVILFISGCKEDDVCLANTQLYVRTFFTVDAEATDNVTVSMRSNTVNTPFGFTGSEIKLILNPLKTEDVFLADFEITRTNTDSSETNLLYTDTLYIKYSSDLKQQSEQCGFYYTHLIQSIQHTNYLIDSISSKSRIVDETRNENIIIHISSK